MVSKMPKPGRLLGELLQEQQEPFSLQVYLMERSHLIRNENEEENSFVKSSNRNSRMVLMKKNRISSSSSSFPHCSKVLRAACSKLVFSDQIQRWRRTITDFECKDQKKIGKEVAEADYRKSIASSGRTLSSSFTDTGIEDISASLSRTKNNASSASHHRILLRQNEDGQSENLQRMREESGKQLSPVSVLVEELPVDEGQLEPQTTKEEPNTTTSSIEYSSKTTKQQEGNTSTSYSSISRRRVTESSILSASLWDLLTRSTTTMSSTNYNNNTAESYIYYLNSKRVLQQRKQLLLDCVREAIASHEKKQIRRHQGRSLPSFLGPEELGKLISEKVTAWGKQSIDETSIGRVLNFELLDSVEEWSSCELGTTTVGEVAKEIGDALFDDLVVEIIFRG